MFKHRLTVAAWLPLCRQLPEMKYVSKRGRKRGMAKTAATIACEVHCHSHLSRLLGAIFLDRLATKDLLGYVTSRSKENIQRWGEQRKGYPVQPGTIANEIGAMGLAYRMAKLYGTRYIEACRDEEDRDREVARLKEQSGLKESVLAALEPVARNPGPDFATAKPDRTPRSRVLSTEEEIRYFKFAGTMAPEWFFNMARLA